MPEKVDEKKMQELQILEQNLQNILLQKQAFQMELRESEAALRELGRSGDEVYKIIGQLMIKTEKNQMKEELEEKKKIIDMRIKSLEKQEQILSEKFEEIQRELIK